MTMTLQEFVERCVAPELREAFEEMASTATGRRLAESSVRRRARYILDPTGKLGGSAMSINLLKLVIIGKEALDNTPWLINSLAHEAAHIQQGYISNSFEQEYVTFVTAARVMTELGLKDPSGWDTPELQSLSPEEAARRIMELYPDHPLYGMNPAIPVYQVRGARGLIEAVKQAWAMVHHPVPLSVEQMEWALGMLAEEKAALPGWVGVLNRAVVVARFAFYFAVALGLLLLPIRRQASVIAGLIAVLALVVFKVGERATVLRKLEVAAAEGQKVITVPLKVREAMATVERSQAVQRAQEILATEEPKPMEIPEEFLRETGQGDWGGEP